jgi:hypothetical protein
MGGLIGNPAIERSPRAWLRKRLEVLSDEGAKDPDQAEGPRTTQRPGASRQRYCAVALERSLRLRDEDDGPSGGASRGD